MVEMTLIEIDGPYLAIKWDGAARISNRVITQAGYDIHRARHGKKISHAINEVNSVYFD